MPLLFVYGTLAPLDEESANREGWLADAVRGRLYDLGPYPALVGHENPTADWVRGYVRTVTWEQLTGIIDSYEGVAEGLFRRVETTSRDGRVVWVYVFAQPVPPTALGPLTRWNSTKRFCLLPAPGQSQGEP
jgi:indolepyruvate decarboxylase